MRVCNSDIILQNEIIINNDIFAITELIGSGGVSEVYIATNESQKNICIKILNPRKTIGLNESVEKRFYHEYNALKNLKHERIVDVYNQGIVKGFKYYSMEYFPNGNLKNYLRNNKLSIIDKFNIFMQICDGLNHIHLNGVHRDLKPDNILIENINPLIIKISDFGTYYDLDNLLKNPETSKNDQLGSLVYIHPKQRNINEERSACFDIYSLGIIFYQMLIDDTFEYRLKPLKNVAELDNIELYFIQKIINKMCENDIEISYNNIMDVLIDFRNKIIIGNDKYNGLYIPKWIKNTYTANSSFTSFNIYHDINYTLNKYAGLKWSYELSVNIDSRTSGYYMSNNWNPPQPLVYKNHVICVSSNGLIICLDFQTGNKLWESKCTDVRFKSLPIISDDNIYAVDVCGKLFCLNICTGNIVWNVNIMEDEIKRYKKIYGENQKSHSREPRFCTCPLKLLNKNLIIVTDERIKLVNIENPNKIQEVDYISTPYFGVFSDPSIDDIIVDGNNVFINTLDEIKAYININDESAFWNDTWSIKLTGKTDSGTWLCFTEMAYDKRFLYIGSNNGDIKSVEASTGNARWEISIGEELASPLAIDDDFLAVLSNRGVLYVIRKEDGLLYKTKKIENDGYDNRNNEYAYSKPIISNRKILVIKEYSLRIFDLYTLNKLSEYNDIDENPSYPTFANDELFIISSSGICVYR